MGRPGDSIPEILSRLAQDLSDQDEPVSIVATENGLPSAAVDDLTTPRPGAATAVIARPGQAVAILHHQIVDVGVDQPLPGGGADLVGILRLNVDQLPVAASALQALADDLTPQPDEVRSESDPMPWIVLALARSGMKIGVDPVDGWPVGDPYIEISDRDAARIRLERANRADDGAYSLLVLRRLSKPLTALAARRGWTPNAITIVSFIIGLAAAAFFATGQRWALIVGAVLLQVSLVVDCSDGEVARLTRQYSAVGAWLDASTDRVKEYAAFAGLAVGAAINGEDVWLWACAALVLQTIRHFGDYTFNRVQVRIETTAALAALRKRSLDPRKDGSSRGSLESAPSGANPAAGPDTDTAARGQDAPAPDFGPILAPKASRDRIWVEKVKKIIHLPIGERWLLISLTAAFLTPWWTFVVLIVLGLLALAYTTLGRTLRCRRWPAEPTGEDIVFPQLDLGPLASLSSGLVNAARRASAGRFGWALPSSAALVELTLWTIAAAWLIPNWLPAAYAVIFVIAFHRYDILYRTMAGKAFPVGLRNSLGGIEGRLLYLIIIAIIGLFAAVLMIVGYLAAAVWLGLIGVLVASAEWIRSNTRDTSR